MSKKILQSYNFAGNQIIDARMENLASFPTAGKAGRFVLNTSTSTLAFDDGSNFRVLAALDSPTFSGNPTAPTPTTGNNSTRLATTAFVQASISGAGAGDMLKATYDSNNDGKVNAADQADNVPWSGVTGKPAEFAPTAHTHSQSEITGLAVTLAGKAAVNHTHTSAQITDLDATVEAKIIAYWDQIAGTDADVDTIREVLDLVKQNASNLAGQIGRYNADIGDGSATSIAVTHNLNSKDVTVEVYETGTGETVGVGVTRINTNVVTIEAFPAPATNALRIVVKK